jgi:choloylglycine hydrolase
MTSTRRLRFCTFLVVITALPWAHPAEACTSMLVRAADGGHVYGRTLEFGLDLRSQFILVPRGYAVTATGPAGEVGKGGLAWKTRYAATGMNALGLPIIVDGVNEKGLAGGMFNFPGYAQFQAVPAGQENRSMASFEVVLWALTNFATVEELRAALPKVIVSGVKLAAFDNAVPPMHFSFHDTAGKSLAVEYVDGGTLRIYDNPTHVFTNAPAFPFHLENLAQYQYVTAGMLPPIQAGSMKLSAASSGDGMYGLPGGGLATARFVRAFFAQQSAPTAPTTAEAVAITFHLMNGFDIPPGSSLISATGGGESGGVTGYERTEWTAATDMKNLRYHVKTFANPDVRVIDLRKANLDAKTIQFIALDQPQMARDLTP